MKVISLKREKSHLVSVAFENGESVLLDIDLCVQKCIHEGDEITDEQISEYKSESDYMRAKSRALWLLDRYIYSERNLFKKLRQAGFGEIPAARAISRLKELGIIDDKSLAYRYAQALERRGVSKREAYGKLYGKGFNSDTINEALEGAAFDEDKQLRELIERKYNGKLLSGDIDKVYAALVRKGFSYSAVRNALKEFSRKIELSGEE
ncbi:MAG: regulatory protein RecX [Clostridia bacterium]|nr:regulatory protein RecX [Clostridia bacterium]